MTRCAECGLPIEYRQVAISGTRSGEPVMRWCVDPDHRAPDRVAFVCNDGSYHRPADDG